MIKIAEAQRIIAEAKAAKSARKEKKREKKERALHYDFRFWKVGEHAERPLARGRLVVVSVGRIAGEVKAIPIPQLFADRIQIAPDALLNQYPEKK